MCVYPNILYGLCTEPFGWLCSVQSEARPRAQQFHKHTKLNGTHRFRANCGSFHDTLAYHMLYSDERITTVFPFALAVLHRRRGVRCVLCLYVAGPLYAQRMFCSILALDVLALGWYSRTKTRAEHYPRIMRY